MPADAGGSVAVEDGPVFGEGDELRGILGRLPVGVFGAALDVVDLLAIEIERHAQFDQRVHLALPRDDAVCRRFQIAQVAGADGRPSATPPGPCTSTTRRAAR